MDLVSVIVVNWNGVGFLPECLEGLRNQEYPYFSGILVDNGSVDGSVEFAERNYPEIRTIALPENLGFCLANNIALRAVKTRYVALLNNDAVAHPLWLKSLVEALDETPEAGFAASKILCYDNPGRIDRAGDSYTRAGTGLLRGRGIQAQEYDRREWVFGACAAAALYRKSMLDEIGLFDEDLFLLYEDVDLSFRAQLRGHRCLYVPWAIVYHKASNSIIHDSPISVYYSHRNLEWVYVKNMPASLMPRTFISHIIYNIAAFLYFSIKGRIIHFLKAKWHALKGLRGALEKRRLIQCNRKVPDEYVWELLDKELFLPRLRMRF